MITPKLIGLGSLLFLPALATALLCRSVTVDNAPAFLFMIVFASLTAGYVVASKWFQEFRPMRRNGKFVLPLMLILTSSCLSLSVLIYTQVAIMPFKQMIASVFE